MKRVNIEGMSCMHCVSHVREALKGLKGVTAVDVNLKEKYATVDGENLSDAEIKSAIEDAGYDVVSIEQL